MTDTGATIAYEDLVTLLRDIFLAHGTSETAADALAANCAAAERDGSHSHGVFRVPGYVSTLRSGFVDGWAVPAVEDVAPAFVRVDARSGFAQVALRAAAPLAEAKAREAGACVVAIRDSHHFGSLWQDVEPFARRGLVALAMVNSMAYVVPHGGHRPVFGTNPMAFAIPRAGGDPIVFDQAVSVLAHGDVQIAARAGRELPEAAGLDRAGRATRDPAAVLDGGALLPFGGHKGASLALMVEVMAAALTGGRFSFEVDWSGHPGAAIPRTGQCLILLDPAMGGADLAPFATRIEQLVDELRGAGQERIPGDRRYALRRSRDGIAIDAAILRGLRDLAAAGRSDQP